MSEIKKYRDIAKSFKNGLPALKDSMPIGYVTAKSVRLYDSTYSDNLSLEKLDVTNVNNTDHNTDHSTDHNTDHTAELKIIDLPIEMSGKWIEINKISLNRQFTYKENNIVVGFLETGEDYMKFKLRKPVHRIREEFQTTEHINDTRLIERGIVCSTKNKFELLKIMAQLGISISKLDKNDIRIKQLCRVYDKS